MESKELRFLHRSHRGGRQGLQQAEQKPGAATDDEQGCGEKKQRNALADDRVVHEQTGAGRALKDASISAQHVNGRHHHTPQGKDDRPLKRSQFAAAIAAGIAQDTEREWAAMNGDAS